MKSLSTKLATAALMAFATLAAYALPACPPGSSSGCIDNYNIRIQGEINNGLTLSSNGVTYTAGKINGTQANGQAGSFINDDYQYPYAQSPTKTVNLPQNTNWSTTAINASYLGYNPSEISLTKYGTVVGIEGYASMAALVTNEFLWGGLDGQTIAALDKTIGACNSTATCNAETVTVFGNTYRSSTKANQITQDLNAAIYWFADQGQATKGSSVVACTSGPTCVAGQQFKIGGTTLDAAAAKMIETLLADYGTKNSVTSGQYAAALSQLQGDNELWILNGGGSHPELWTQFSIPEGGAALAYLLMALCACFGAVVLARRQNLATSIA